MVRIFYFYFKTKPVTKEKVPYRHKINYFCSALYLKQEKI
jgi:hypothetical protein